MRNVLTVVLTLFVSLLNSTVHASMSHADGLIVVANKQGLLSIVDGQNGSVLRSISGYGQINATGRLSNGNMVLGTSAGQVYVVNPEDINTPVSHLNLGNFNISAIGVQSNDNIIIASNVVIDGDYTDANDRTGYAWRYNSALTSNLNFASGLPNVSMVAIQSNDNVIFGCPIINSSRTAIDGYIYHWGPDFGAGGSGFHSGMTGLSDVSVDSYGNIVILSSTTGMLWQMDPTWTTQIRSFGGLANADGAAYGINGDIYVMDSTNGYVWHWTKDFATASGFHSGFGPVNSMTNLSNGQVVFGRSDGWVLIRWSSDLLYVDQQQYAANIIPGGVYATSADQIITINRGGRIKVADTYFNIIANSGGYGCIADIELQSNNNIVLANTGGEVYIIDHANLNNVLGYIYLNANVSAIGVQSNNNVVITSDVVLGGDYRVVGNRTGVAWRYNSTLTGGNLNIASGLANPSMVAIQSNDNVVFGCRIIDSNGVDTDGYVYHWGPDFGAGGSGFHYGMTGLSDVSVDNADNIVLLSSKNGYAWRLNPGWTQQLNFVTGLANADGAAYGLGGDIYIIDSTNGYVWHWKNDWTAASGFHSGFPFTALSCQLDGDLVAGRSSGDIEIWNSDLSVLQYQQGNYGNITDLLIIPVAPAPLGETVTVNFNSELGTVTHNASGFLHSMSPVVPDSSKVVPLKMRLFRGTDFPLDQTGGVLDNYDRLVALGAAGQVILNSAFTVGVVGGVDYGWPGDTGNPHQNGYQAWETFVTSRVQSIVNQGVQAQYDIWNEPDSGFLGGKVNFFETWKRAYNIIRYLDPDAIIVGPSSSAYSLPGGYFTLTEFLDYAKGASVLPDMIAFHSWTPERVTSEVASVRAWMNTNLGSSTARGIQINEYVYDDQKNDPGILVSYFKSLEDSQVNGACHACWEEEIANTYSCFNGSLDGILTPEREPRATYWVYRGYADITGTLVGVSSNGQTVKGLAGKDSGAVTATVLLGRDKRYSPNTTATIPLVLSNIPSYLVNAEGKIKIVAERVEDNGWDVLASPVPAPEHNLYTVTGNTVEMQLGYFRPSDAYVLRLYNPDGGCGYPGTEFKDGDLNSDCIVDISDLSILVNNWLGNNTDNYGGVFVGNQFGQLWLLNGQDLSLEQREDEIARLNQTPGQYFGSIKILKTLSNGNLVLVNADGEVFVVDHRYLQHIVGYWDSGLNITDIVVQSDDDVVLVSNVVAGGNYADPCDRTGVAYIWNKDLSVNKHMSDGFDNPVCIAVQSNDNVLIGCDVSGDGYIYHRGADLGSGASGFHSGFAGISDIGVSPIDNSIMIISKTSGLLWHYLADFSGVASGTHSGFANASTIEFQSDGRILIGDSTNGYVWHFKPDFTSASGFHDGYAGLSAIDVQYDNSIIVVSSAGNIWHFDSNWTIALHNLNGFATLLDVASIPGNPAVCDDGVTQYLAGDLNKDCRIDLIDMAKMGQSWLE